MSSEKSAEQLQQEEDEVLAKAALLTERADELK